MSMNPHRFNPFTLSGFKYSFYRIKKQGIKRKSIYFLVFFTLLY
ncbi:hypothetical protein HMPREF9441_01135 [Paraprevotella clara YIT 11840]|uniref:Uncharacterized protein n=1 Tax=Paraprevotella clara YIT 11840 TaxID=762968 RepID=G5SNX3_9BACT|nr:hypothetical protein HMPREF9441_01135 [Paraprevotella clara YIT 11840]